LGCGVFRNDPFDATGIFRERLLDNERYRNAFKAVVFAFLDLTRARSVFDAFQKHLVYQHQSRDLPLLCLKSSGSLSNRREYENETLTSFDGMCAEHILLAHPTLPDRLTVRLSGITQK
jgi:hypothetical protein